MKFGKTLRLEVTPINQVCNAGEEFGRKCRNEGKIPIFSCEGGFIKGEIARQAANLVAEDDGYARACHGEMFTAPRSAMAEWAMKAKKVVVIDGCFMRCHGRIMKNIVGRENMIQFDALPIYNKDNKYSEIMLVEEIPETEIKYLAQQVADKVLKDLQVMQCADEFI